MFVFLNKQTNIEATRGRATLATSGTLFPKHFTFFIRGWRSSHWHRKWRLHWNLHRYGHWDGYRHWDRYGHWNRRWYRNWNGHCRRSCRSVKRSRTQENVGRITTGVYNDSKTAVGLQGSFHLTRSHRWIALKV